MAYVAILGRDIWTSQKLIIWSLKTFDKVFQGKWSYALIIAWSSPRATSFPSTPVLSHPCLKKGLSTANPSCLGGRLLSVVEGVIHFTPLTLAYLGLQETPAGLTFTTWGAPKIIFLDAHCPSKLEPNNHVILSYRMRIYKLILPYSGISPIQGNFFNGLSHHSVKCQLAHIGACKLVNNTTKALRGLIPRSGR